MFIILRNVNNFFLYTIYMNEKDENPCIYSNQIVLYS